jgi:hypothetical protein
MLRITSAPDGGGGRLVKLEGKLLGPWVEEVARACESASEGRVSLDLSALTFVDEAGRLLLRELLSRGVVVALAAPLVAELLRREGT